MRLFVSRLFGGVGHNIDCSRYRSSARTLALLTPPGHVELGTVSGFLQHFCCFYESLSLFSTIFFLDCVQSPYPV